MIRSKKLIMLIFLFGALNWIRVCANDYSLINDNWKFIQSDVSGAQLKVFDDSSWSIVSVPHTWNALDGQDGGGNYARTKAWYRKHIILSAYTGKILYLRFSAVCTKAMVYLNGNLLGTHLGGYGAFMYDITGKFIPGQENVIAVQVDNSAGILCPPLSADFNHDGGITRDVQLVVASPVHFNCNEYIANKFTLNGGVTIAQSGVIVKQNNVSSASADVSIIARIKNGSASSQSVSTDVQIVDQSGVVVKSINSKSVTLNASDTVSLLLSTTLSNPHLWDGLNDPYLYQVHVILKMGAEEADRLVQPLGIRFFSLDANKGFFLNGKSYPLRGVSLHENKINKGHALTDSDRREAIDMLRETGLNYIRLSHYQHGDFTYNYLDSLGIICWTEIPNINSVGTTTADNITYTGNAVTNMYELLRQQYNHPCIITWGVSNEIDYLSTISPVWTDSILNQLVKSEDNYRPTTLAAMGADKTVNMVPDTYSNNRYDGWYSSTISGFATAMDALHAKYPTKVIGVSEYGAGANPLQHEYPAAQPATAGQWHPEEYQNKFHEEYLKAINARPYFWSTSLWIGIDFAVDGRNEGLHPGLNDKGIINFDRTIKKDAFYWYKANWNKKDYFVYISSRRYSNRTSLINPVRIYSNCDSVFVSINGQRTNTKTSTDHIFMFDSLSMQSGLNHILSIGFKDGMMYRDSVDWNCVDSGTVPAFPVVDKGELQINFQKSSTATPSGYLSDNGAVYAAKANGYSYGWNADNSANARERSTASDIRFDTFIHMQVGGTYSWSIALPNHLYKVTIASGDPGYTDSYHKIMANGVTVIDFIPTANYKYGVGSAYVNVVNGKLMVEPANGSVNAKMDFVHITTIDTTKTELLNLTSDRVQLVRSGSQLIIQGEVDKIDCLQLYTVTGQLLLNKSNLCTGCVLDLKDRHGIYIVWLKSGFEAARYKVVL